MLAMPAFAEVTVSSRSTTIVRADEKSGRLVRTTVVVKSVAVEPVPVTTAKVVTAKADQPPVSDLGSLVDRIALEQGVEDSLVHSVIRAESNYDPRAISAKGALGIMQLIPATARRFGVVNAFDPRENIEGGVRYLKFLLDYYRNDYARTIAAYNAGEGAVDKYQGIPPYPETQNYVFRVAKNLKSARQIRARQTPAEPAKVAVTGTIAETHQAIQASIGEDGRVYYHTP